MNTKKYIKYSLFLVSLVFVFDSCCPPCCPTPTEPYNCSGSGTHGIFVAIFDADPIGSLPTTTLYGPPGADLEIVNGTNTVEVVNSTALASKALKITRPSGSDPTVVKGKAGILDGVPNNSGKFYINFRAHGDIIPEHLIAGIAIAVMSEKDEIALNMKLFDGAYHLLEGNQPTRLSGPYNPGTGHEVHILVDMDSRRYSICINGEAVASNKPIQNSSFSDVGMVRFFTPATVTEAFSMTYIIDDIRILK
ncbi:MAG: hypothetical protein JSU92_04965 [Deltaproteobacteria bacterium]|nr:MAG: hypothetical protein JSU92_04965 [Deltaproteobacteria bacterium]